MTTPGALDEKFRTPCRRPEVHRRRPDKGWFGAAVFAVFCKLLVVGPGRVPLFERAHFVILHGAQRRRLTAKTALAGHNPRLILYRDVDRAILQLDLHVRESMPATRLSSTAS